MKLTLTLLVLSIVLFSMAACASPAEFSAGVAAVGASATILINSLAPLIPPEDLAKLQLTAANIDGTVEATATAVRTVCDAIAQMKSAAGVQIAQVATELSKTTAQLASVPSREELYLGGGGMAAAGTAVSRVLSHFKHAEKPQPKPA